MVGTQLRAGILVGVAAALVGAAATLSAATAPPARADDLTELINDLNIDHSYGQTAFEAAYADFTSDQFAPGLAQLLGGFDDYTLAPRDTLILATVEVLSGDPVNSTSEYGFMVPATFADAESLAHTFFTNGVADFSIAAQDFSTGDYVSAAINEVLASEYSSIIPLQELLVGAAASF